MEPIAYCLATATPNVQRALRPSPFYDSLLPLTPHPSLPRLPMANGSQRRKELELELAGDEGLALGHGVYAAPRGRVANS
jgi:hypothetical protein